MHPYVHRSIIYNSQDLETAQVPIGRQADKDTVVHSHNGILHSSKTPPKLLTFAKAWMDLEVIIQSEISQSEKDKFHVISYEI